MQEGHFSKVYTDGQPDPKISKRRITPEEISDFSCMPM